MTPYSGKSYPPEMSKLPCNEIKTKTPASTGVVQRTLECGWIGLREHQEGICQPEKNVDDGRSPPIGTQDTREGSHQADHQSGDRSNQQGNAHPLLQVCLGHIFRKPKE